MVPPTKRLFLASLQSRSQEFHELFFPSESAGRGISARDDLAENGEIGNNTEISLSAARSHSERGHDFVEYEDSSVFVAELPYSTVEITVKRPGSAFGAYRLDEDRCCSAAELVPAQLAFKGIEIIWIEFLGVFEAVTGNAVGLEVFGPRDPYAVCELVAPAVVGAAHL